MRLSTHLARMSFFFEVSSFSTAADVIFAYLPRSFASSHAKNLRVLPPFFSVYGSRPKWQYAALTLYLGWRRTRSRARAPGRASKLSLTMLVMVSGVRPAFSVPYVSTKSESGLATPMAYESCTRARLHRPDLTMDLAIQRHAYAAERSTLVGSLPEKAPPPCAPQPPYVSMMILRPVRPASPCGPPMMNLPDGLMCRLHSSRLYSESADLPFLSVIDLSVATMTFSWMASFMSSIEGAYCSLPLYFWRKSLPFCSSVRLALIGSACWVEMTTVWISVGSTEPSAICWYLMVTCVLPSGRSHQHVPSLRTSVRTLPSLVAIRWVSGMHDSVSSEA